MERILGSVVRGLWAAPIPEGDSELPWTFFSSFLCASFEGEDWEPEETKGLQRNWGLSPVLMGKAVRGAENPVPEALGEGFGSRQGGLLSQLSLRLLPPSPKLFTCSGCPKFCPSGHICECS
jgi:hypothetical protein